MVPLARSCTSCLHFFRCWIFEPFFIFIQQNLDYTLFFHIFARFFSEFCIFIVFFPKIQQFLKFCWIFRKLQFFMQQHSCGTKKTHDHGHLEGIMLDFSMVSINYATNVRPPEIPLPTEKVREPNSFRLKQPRQIGRCS